MGVTDEARVLGEELKLRLGVKAIEIAKKYGMETSGAFVNGILDRLPHHAFAFGLNRAASGPPLAAES